jgi:hypothetical protein
MEDHRHAAKKHSPAFASKEFNCFLSGHFRDQPSIDRSTLSEIASASASEVASQSTARYCSRSPGQEAAYLSQPQER